LTKSELRQKIIREREKLGAEEREHKSAKIRSRMMEFPLYQQAKHLFTFVPFREEVNIRSLIDNSIARNKQVSIPKTDPLLKRITPHLFTGWELLVKGPYGILEPDGAQAVKTEHRLIDFMLLPGVAFTRNGHRLGYGGGYYDRFLQGMIQRPPLVAVAFTEQVVEALPIEEHDVRIDFLITDQELIDCRKKE
jgi:5-formyltetrahydrofolate cyclo-ligase